MADGFFDKLVSRLDKLNPESIQAQLLRMAQERGFLETIFQTIQEGVMVVNNSGVLTYANRAAERLIGFDYGKLKGRSILRYLRDWDWESIIVPQESSQWSSFETREIEISYPEHRFISFYAMPMNREETPDSTEVLLLLRDITHTHLQEASVLESERINAIKILAAGVAHEIGNPLNALTIHLQLLNRKVKSVEDEEIRKSLQDLTAVAEHEVSRLDAIIRQFLNAIRPSKPDLQPGDLRVALSSTLKILENDLKNRSICMTLNVPAEIPAVRFDRQQMEQVFFNILKNAMEAVCDGGRIGVTVTATDSSVCVSFLDNGVGIPPEQLGSIFDPYVTNKKSGNGLGLMIVQRIVSEHGGSIETASSPNEGTCFTIRLPRAEKRIFMLQHENG